MIRLEHSATLPEARDRFLDDIHAWIVACMDRYADEAPTDVHDQGTYTTSWEPYIKLTGDEDALRFMQQTSHKIRDHFVATDQWQHGYWRMHEAHHGTEHFELFHGALLRLAPNDDETNAILLDAAEHMGNWSTDVAPWFDWESGLFYSSFFGTDGVKLEPGMALNIPDHMRCINIALLAHQATGDQRYLDLAIRYSQRWATAILAADAIISADIFPIGMTENEILYDFDPAREETYRSYMGEASALQTPVDRAENFLCSGMIDTFLLLWQATANDDFRHAVERILDPLSTQLADPSAGAAADVIRTYRRATSDTRYDEAVINAVRGQDPRDVKTMALDPIERYKNRPSGIGKRSDMPHWLENDAPRQMNPITLAVAAEILENEAMAVGALDLARSTFGLARTAFRDGRHHGCAAQTISAVGRGHGRENHAGVITAVLGSLCEAFDCTSIATVR